MAIMSDSSIALKPVMEEPSKPIPPSNASSSSSALMEKLFSCPRMSVNQRRMKRMSRSWTRALTSSAVFGWSAIGLLRGIRIGGPAGWLGSSASRPVRRRGGRGSSTPIAWGDPPHALPPRPVVGSRSLLLRGRPYSNRSYVGRRGLRGLQQAALFGRAVERQVPAAVDHAGEYAQRDVGDRLEQLLVGPALFARLLLEVQGRNVLTLEQAPGEAQERRLAWLGGLEAPGEVDLVEAEA